MADASRSRHPIRFAAFEVDLTSGELRKQGLRIRLQEQPFAVLATLLETPGEVVTREELIRRLWPDGTVVDFDRGLNAAVTRLRQALSDSAETPRYVETVARRGYRFIGVLAPADDPLPVPPVATPPTTPPGRSFPRLAAVAAILVAAVAGLWFFLGRTRPSERTWQVTPLTTDPGNEMHATFSPDGSQVAYQGTSGEAGPFVFIKLVGPGDPIRLTSSAEAEYSPVWSPDGQSIAFVRVPSQRTMAVFVIPALGGVERKVAEFPLEGAWIWVTGLRQLDWTRDSRHLIVSALDRPGENTRLWLISLANGEKRWLTTGTDNSTLAGDREPAVSPDGRYVAFVRGALTTSETLFLLPMGPDLQPSNEPKRLTTGGSSRNPAWMPDGKTLVYKPLRHANSGLAALDIRTGARRDLPELGTNLLLPAIARDGRMVYSRSVSDIDIWRHEIGGTSARLISSTAFDADAQYSPDGAHIAFESDRSGWLEIWVCGADGRHCAQMTNFHGSFITGTPRWSPDSKRIAFDSGASGRFNIYTVDAAGGPVRQLTTDRGAIPSWSRDGRWIYFLRPGDGNNQIWKIPSGGGTPVPVTRNGGFVAFESPDGQSLYYTKTEADATLFRCALDGSGETEILRGVAHRGFALAPDRIYYMKETPNRTTELRRHLLASGDDTTITEIDRQGYLGLSLSPDGKYLTYGRAEHRGGDLMLALPQ